MFDHLFKKDAAPVSAAPQRTDAQSSTGAAEDEPQAWRDKIHAAEGDDGALLQFAHQAPSVDLKLAALAALTQEDALKQAMREFRDQDKRLYRAAKSRWQRRSPSAKPLRKPRPCSPPRAACSSRSLPANRLVELDRAWAALSEALLDEALAGEFAAVRSQLGTRGARARRDRTGARPLAWLLRTPRSTLHGRARRRVARRGGAGIADAGRARPPSRPQPCWSC